MLSYSIRTFEPNTYSKDWVYMLLDVFGNLLPRPLSDRVDLIKYSEKIAKYAYVIVANSEKETIALAILYANDHETRIAHLPIIAVLPSAQGNGIGKSLLHSLIQTSRSTGMHQLTLETDIVNISARKLYLTAGFSEKAISQHRLEYTLVLTQSQ